MKIDKNQSNPLINKLLINVESTLLTQKAQISDFWTSIIHLNTLNNTTSFAVNRCFETTFHSQSNIMALLS